MKAIPKRFANGVEFFRAANQAPLDTAGYFICMDVLRPLFIDEEFRKTTPGFYLNARTLPDDNGLALRLVYFSLNPAETQKSIREFVERNRTSLALCESKESSRPTLLPGEELAEEDFRFFSFLNANTQIFLDVSKSFGVPQLQALVFAYRYFCLPNRIPPEAVFEWVFSRHSEYFKRLQAENLDKDFWIDLVSCFHETSVNPDFALHFLVNMSLVREDTYAMEFFKKNWILR